MAQGPLTVFAPTDKAFAKLSDGTSTRLMKLKKQGEAVYCTDVPREQRKTAYGGIWSVSLGRHDPGRPNHRISLGDDDCTERFCIDCV
ncbi:fasciclin domain-containing protein [Rubripirellula reticaptiva]|uniref:fasciclin domain-containing protein n=1 Tax=Rubripirellula reticaptiva TaxID=2528013 RepID=UPI0011B3FF04